MNITINKFEDPRMIEALELGLPKNKKKILAETLRASECTWIGLVDNKVACVWGVSLPTIMSNRAYLWLWTSELVKEHPFVFIRRAQIVVRELLEEYEVVTGVVNTKEPGASSSVRWLKLLGAKFNEPTSKGLIPFYIRKL